MPCAAPIQRVTRAGPFATTPALLCRPPATWPEAFGSPRFLTQTWIGQPPSLDQCLGERFADKCPRLRLCRISLLYWAPEHRGSGWSSSRRAGAGAGLSAR